MQLIEHAHCLIYIVDDNPANLKLLQRMLKAEGFSNIVAIEDSRQFEQKFDANKPDLVLLDINMPHLDGFDILNLLQEKVLAIKPPVIMLTAQDNYDFVLKALSLGARDYLTKPFNKIELLMRLNNLLESQLAHRMVLNQAEVLSDMVKRRTEELEQTRLKVVHRLGMAAEFKDEETGDHIVRMSQMCMLLARELGWDEYHCELILHASPMHDIGKIGIPDDILLKPGNFTPDEWTIMKTHTEIGYRLLDGDDSELMLMAKDIAIGHHEKWDGSGYPKGLKGEQIPQSARIAALADVFDALISVRPYKSAWPVEDAIALIKRESGHHFEPIIVNAFMDNLDAILQ